MLLNADDARHQLYFIGAVDGMERKLVAVSGLDFADYFEVYAGPVHGVSPLRLTASLMKLAVGTLQAFTALFSTRPQVILLTGGWANLPVAVAARLLRIPIVIYLPDIEPGLTIRALQRFAAKIAITAEPSRAYLPPEKTVITGYPLPENRLKATRARGIAHFCLDPARQTLLVFGGSRGARSINSALTACLDRLLDRRLQIIHVTGEFDWQRTQGQTRALQNHPHYPHYHAFPYLHDEMGLAFAAADLALCRAGASTLAELPLFGLAAILVPYPHAWRYQKVNADYLSQRGAAIRLNDEDMPSRLYETISALLDNDGGRLAAMRAKSKTLANPHGARLLANLLTQTGGA